MRGVKILKQEGDPFWAQSLTKLRFFELEQVVQDTAPGHIMGALQFAQFGYCHLSMATVHAIQCTASAGLYLADD